MMPCPAFLFLAQLLQLAAGRPVWAALAPLAEVLWLLLWPRIHWVSRLVVRGCLDEPVRETDHTQVLAVDTLAA